MVIILVIELIVGFIALRRITKHQAKKFHLHQLSVNIILDTPPDPKKDLWWLCILHTFENHYFECVVSVIDTISNLAKQMLNKNKSPYFDFFPISS